MWNIERISNLMWNKEASNDYISYIKKIISRNKCNSCNSKLRISWIWALQCENFKCRELYSVPQIKDFLHKDYKNPIIDDSSTWKSPCSKCDSIMNFNEEEFCYECSNCWNILEV